MMQNGFQGVMALSSCEPGEGEREEMQPDSEGSELSFHRTNSIAMCEERTAFKETFSVGSEKVRF